MNNEKNKLINSIKDEFERLYDYTYKLKADRDRIAATYMCKKIRISLDDLEKIVSEEQKNESWEKWLRDRNTEEEIEKAYQRGVAHGRYY